MRTGTSPLTLSPAEVGHHLEPLPGWKLGHGGGGISLRRELTFPTTEIACAFLSFASGLAATFRQRAVFSSLGRVVKVSLGNVERKSVTPRELAFARALMHVEASFHAASFAGALESSLATVADDPCARRPA